MKALYNSTILHDELLEQIFSLIDDHIDLLSLSLASRHFSALVHPHIQYRVIRCTLATNELWRKLAECPLLAHQVRVVEIQSQYRHLGIKMAHRPLPIVPKAFMACAMDKKNRLFYHGVDTVDHAQCLEAEGLLIAALTNMKNLKRFVWDREPPYYNCRAKPGDKKDLWGTLKDCCPLLTELEVMDACDFAYGEHRNWRGELFDEKYTPIHDSNIWFLPQSLTSFKYHTYSYRYAKKPIPVDEMTSFLRRSPNLEILSLFFTLYPTVDGPNGEDVSTADLNPLFKDIHWPRLRELHLGSTHVSPSTAATFFKRHSHLEALTIIENTWEARFVKNEDGSQIPRSVEPLFDIIEGGLPNCTKIYIPKRVFPALFPGRGNPNPGEVHDWDRRYTSPEDTIEASDLEVDEISDNDWDIQYQIPEEPSDPEIDEVSDNDLNDDAEEEE